MLEFFNEFYLQPYHKFKFYKLYLFYRAEHNIAAFTTNKVWKHYKFQRNPDKRISSLSLGNTRLLIKQNPVARITTVRANKKSTSLG